MINRILFSLIRQWRERSAIRRHYVRFNAWMQQWREGSPVYRGVPFKPCAVPEWGMCAAIARRVLYLFFFLRFRDLTWRQCRRLASDPESVETAGRFWDAHQRAFHTYREYDFSQWLLSRNPARYPALPRGMAVLALPEGRETVLGREIDHIQKESHHGCGLYYEIYEPRVLRALRKLHGRLDDYDREVFGRLLTVFGWDISDESFAASIQAEAVLMEELYEE